MLASALGVAAFVASGVGSGERVDSGVAAGVALAWSSGVDACVGLVVADDPPHATRTAKTATIAGTRSRAVL
jgi:hypothetical protein